MGQCTAWALLAARYALTQSIHGLSAPHALFEQGVETVAQAYLFGQFIGNTDMHFGNLSFFVDNVARPRFEVAPVYDMLPMMWRPSIHSGSLDAEPLRQPTALAGLSAQADAVRDWAVDYWQRATAMRTLGPELETVCEANVQRLKNRFAGL